MPLELQMTMEGQALAREQDHILEALVTQIGAHDREFALTAKRPPMGGFGAIDPATATFIVQVLGATSVTAVAAGISRVALEWVRRRNIPMKIRVGRAHAEVPAGASVEDIERVARVLAAALELSENKPKRKPQPRK